jgi:hypothetical protein
VLRVVVLDDRAQVECEGGGVSGAEGHQRGLAVREDHAVVLELLAAQRQQATHLLAAVGPAQHSSTD